MGSAMHGTLRAKLKVGKLDYALGGHPLWEMFRAVYQMTRRPYVVGGVLVLSGYVWAAVRGIERPVSRGARPLPSARADAATEALSGRPHVRAVAHGGPLRAKPAAVVRAPAAGDGFPNGRAGALIVNADDWGRDPETTRMILDCVRRQAVSAASAMVFMEDSERAADLAGEASLDCGLHLNVTTPFSASRCSPGLVDRQATLARYLRRHRLAQVVYHPGLASSFAYVVRAQIR